MGIPKNQQLFLSNSDTRKALPIRLEGLVLQCKVSVFKEIEPSFSPKKKRFKLILIKQPAENVSKYLFLKSA
ncbi:hypothetical protein FRX31_035330 [Thalictrum thalictroides]|uniref:Uncharacterized protein n=1 Tax=Thalictrum thalictroides TaxID=46969 RepID=A0A7J6US44_THATH|nr:hypothetical protein FRX31_035330 [Thalictrum thalictroides]